MKKIIHALTIIDKSSSMLEHRSKTIEGINASLNELRKEADKDTKILNTLLQFSVPNDLQNWRNPQPDTPETLARKYVFTHIGKDVTKVKELTEEDYIPDGGTPLLDSIGYGIEEIKKFHGDKLGDDNLKIIVTVFTDGDENSSKKWKHADISQMVKHFEEDGRWTFTFVGCGSLENVTKTSGTLGIAANNTVAYAAMDLQSGEATKNIATSYCNYARSTKMGLVDDTLFIKKSLTVVEKK